MVAGRPQEYDRIKIAKDLIDWSKKKDSINLCGFCMEYDLDPNCLLEWNRVDEKFSRSYRMAKANLGFRREQMVSAGKLHQLAYSKNSRTYDPFLKSEEKEASEFESSLKVKEQSIVSEADVQRHNDLMDQVKSLQSSRKIDNNNSKAEAKS